MNEHAKRSLDIIHNSGRYVKIPGVPVFKEHTKYDAAGNQQRVDKKKLEEIAEKCNNRAANGDLSPGGGGHTISGAKESDQPSIWSFFDNYRLVKLFDKEQGKDVWHILADEYIKPTVKTPDMGELTWQEALNEYPRRSVEYWAGEGDGFFDWIAHLRKTPQLDLGLMMFEKGATVPYAGGEFYADPRAKTRIAARRAVFGKREKIFYSMEQPIMPYDDPTTAPDANRDAEFEGKCDKYMKSRYPRMDDMHMKYDKEFPPVDPDADNDKDGIPNDQDPTPEGKKPMPDTMDDDAEVQKFAKGFTGEAKTLAIKYGRLERQNKILLNRFDDLDKSRKADADRFSKADAENLVTMLQTEGFEMDRDAEIAEVADLPLGEKRQQWAAKVRKYYKQDETGAQPPPRLLITVPRDSNGKPVAGGAEPSPEEVDAAIKYMRKSGEGDLDAAIKYCRGQK